MSTRNKKNGQAVSRPREYRTDIYETYAHLANNWIALSPDESQLLGYSPDLAVVTKLAKEKGCDKPRYIRIPPADINFAF